jgi:hypothetical protein
MTQLTYKEIEELQHIINTAMFELDDIPTNLYSLKLKLIKMRAELEYPRNRVELTEEQIINTI